MIRPTTYLIASLCAALVACAGTTEPAATVPAVDGSYKFQVALGSSSPATGTFTVRRVGPVLRDSSSGRQYQQLDGTVTFDGHVSQGGCDGASAASCVNALTLSPTDQWPQYRSLVDETGRVALAASRAGMLGFYAELAPAGAGRLAGAYHALVPATHVYFEDGTVSAERQP